MTKLLCLLGVFLLTACSTRPLATPAEFSETSYEPRYLPSLGVTSVAETGSNLYEEYVEAITRRPQAKLLGQASAEIAGEQILYAREGVTVPIRKVGNTGTSGICLAPITRDKRAGNGFVCLTGSGDGSRFDQVLYLHSRESFPLSTPVVFEVVDKVSRQVSDLKRIKQTVLYQGVSKGVVRISFREFVNDMARPAFTQDVSYDLDTDGTGTIAFKGLRIFVAKATSSTVTYRVMKPFE